MTPKIIVRKANYEDKLLLLNWANDPMVRQTSFTNDSILLDEHEVWFAKKLNSKDSLILIFEINRKPIGQSRIDVNNDNLILSYSIDKDHRGNGYGRRILNLTTLYILNHNISQNSHRLIAKVKADNISSIKTIERSGYNLLLTEKHNNEITNVYSLPLPTSKIPSIVIANTNPIYQELVNKMVNQYHTYIIDDHNKLTSDVIKKINPEYIFFPHWSHDIPKEIYLSYNCVVFHMTDLPYGRGGSPLQNLIIQDHKETNISALKVSKGNDTYPIYLKRKLSLLGSAEEIFLRASQVIEDIIIIIIHNDLSPTPPIGDRTTFQRRIPQENNIKDNEKPDKSI